MITWSQLQLWNTTTFCQRFCLSGNFLSQIGKHQTSKPRPFRPAKQDQLFKHTHRLNSLRIFVFQTTQLRRFVEVICAELRSRRQKRSLNLQCMVGKRVNKNCSAGIFWFLSCRFAWSQGNKDHKAAVVLLGREGIRTTKQLSFCLVARE